jgi:hypothetical protein
MSASLITAGAVRITHAQVAPGAREWLVCCDVCSEISEPGEMPELDESWQGELLALEAMHAHARRHPGAGPTLALN